MCSVANIMPYIPYHIVTYCMSEFCINTEILWCFPPPLCTSYGPVLRWYCSLNDIGSFHTNALLHFVKLCDSDSDTYCIDHYINAPCNAGHLVCIALMKRKQMHNVCQHACSCMQCVLSCLCICVLFVYLCIVHVTHSLWPEADCSGLFVQYRPRKTTAWKQSL